MALCKELLSSRSSRRVSRIHSFFLDIADFCSATAFLGIPFAQPPIGNLRLRRPQRLNTTYDGTYSVTAYPPFCPGFGSDNWGYEANEVSSLALFRRF